jgi:serine/threonine-protein kinase
VRDEAAASGCESLPLTLAGQVDAACDRFEADWRSGGRPCIEDHLAGLLEPERSALLHRLLALEFAYRTRHGERPTPEEYGRRFPEHLPLVAWALAEATTPAGPLPGVDRPTATARAVADDATADVGSFAPECVPDRGGGYQLRGEVARGGMGMVLRGYDAELDRELAVKVLLQGHHDRPDLVRRFHREAKIHGQLQHPGVAPVHRLGCLPDGRPFFAMKLVEGQTLAALLKDRIDWDRELPDFLRMFEQVCQTIAYAHSKAIIHRDLKPSNIMVGAFGEVQVMDWGLARRLRAGATDRVDHRPATPPESSALERISPDPTGAYAAPDTDVEQLTQAGAAVGTPAYMAPEQARGESDRLDERCDVFGLGAILCEILTGKAPYPTGDSFEALRRAQGGDLVDAFSRLDGCGADVELITLAKRCLAPELAGRPRHAGEVTTAVAAYQHSVAERLRHTELERAAAEARAVEEARTRQMAEAKAAEERKRRQVTLALAVAVVALVVAGGGGAMWLWQMRTAMVRDVEAALSEVESHAKARRWPEVRAVLERAEGRLGGLGLEALWARLRQARLDADLVAAFEEIRLGQSRVIEWGTFDSAGTAEKYAEAFRRYNIDVTRLEAAEAAARVRNSTIRDVLIAALDDWMRLKGIQLKSPAEWAQLRAMADEADDSTWRRAIRAAFAVRDAKTLKAMAGQEEALMQPPEVLFVLGEELRLCDQQEEATTLWRRALHRYPGDFWLNFELGNVLCFKLPRPRLDEGIGYFRAASAIRPRSTAAHNNLGNALMARGDLDDAIAELGQALTLDPMFSLAHSNLGMALLAKRDHKGAIAEFRLALELDEKNPHALNNLAWILATCANPRLRDPRRAIDLAKRAVALLPENRGNWNTLGVAYYRHGNWEWAVEALEKSMALSKGGDSNDWFFLAMAAWQMGHREEARRWYQQAADWMEKHASKDADLLRFRAEAAHLLGLSAR